MEIIDTSVIGRILLSFGLAIKDFSIERIGSGHIHKTYKLRGKVSYVLQRVNKDVFNQPGLIATNLQAAGDYLKVNYPDFPFLRCIPSLGNDQMVYDPDGFPWRLFPYWENTVTIDKVETPAEAFAAASEFARLTIHLNGIDVSKFRETIPRFHDLHLRYQQFEGALEKAAADRKANASECIDACKGWQPLVKTYHELVNNGSLKLRITHNDTKINNILFDSTTGRTVCVIDLDTLMPGYFIYDLGDMVRTFVSPVSEEEKDFSKITFRTEMYDALVSGYLSQMDQVLSPTEKAAIPFAGKMMTYIMALRFLTDYLGGDHYYHTQYEGHNLIRAGNQLYFLEKLSLV